MNPFRGNPEYEPLFAKWGRPSNLGREANGDFRYRCDACAAGWVGPNGDVCDWCHQRWLMRETDRRASLLYPEWLTWDDAYFNLGKLSQSVWEETRGFRGDFVGPWLQRIKKAKANGEITNDDAVAAGRRFKQWMIRKQSARLKNS